MLLVGQLYGKSNNGFQKNVNVVDVVDNVVDVVDVVDKTGNVVNVSNENHALNVHDRRERLLDLISANASISIAELALIMAVTKRTVDRDLSWLKEQGYISQCRLVKES